MDALTRSGVQSEDIQVVWVPGSFEIPVTAKKMGLKCAATMRSICLGALIKGETPHFDHLSAAVTQGVSQVALESGIPVSFGVLTTNDLEQANGTGRRKQGSEGMGGSGHGNRNGKSLSTIKMSH